MASSWEIVGKPSRKGKLNSNQTKASKRTLSENMLRIEPSAPVQESETIYDAFREKDKIVKETVKPESPSASKKTHVKGKQRNGTMHKKTMNLEDALNQLDIEELKGILSKDQITFPDSPHIWLKDLVSVINIRLDKVQESSPVFEGKPKNYPTCLLTKKMKALLVKHLLSNSDEVLLHFFDHCMRSMVDDMSKSYPTYGYRLLIQLLALERPDIVIFNIKKHAETIRSHYNRPPSCLSMMWALGQVGNTSLFHGIRVWLEVMQPALHIRSLSNYSISYLEELFQRHGDIKVAHGSIGIEDFFPLQDLVYGSGPNLHALLEKRLLFLYPKMKEIAYGSHPENTLRNMFPSFLARVSPKTSREMRAEVLSCLVDCLKADEMCYSLWRQMYTKRLGESMLLLQHILDNWNSLKGQLDSKLMKENIQAFSITNEEMTAAGKGGGDTNYKQCEPICKELLLKLNAARYPWRLFVHIILFVFIGIVAVDIYISGEFKKSKIHRFLVDSGLLVCFEQISSRVRVYSERVLRWLSENVPIYVDKTWVIIGPYMTLVFAKLQEMFILAEQATQPHRAWIVEKCHSSLEQLNSQMPWLQEYVAQTSFMVANVVMEWTNQAYTFISIHSVSLWEKVQPYFNAAGIWLQENVFTGSLSGDNILRSMTNTLTTLQGYSSSIFEKLSQSIGQK